MSRKRLFPVTLLAVVLGAAPLWAAERDAGLKKGTPDLKSAGPLAFGPQGILFVGDPQGAAIFAVDTGDRGPLQAGPLDVSKIDEKIAAMLGTTARDLLIKDLAVNPLSANAYLSVARGKGAGAQPVILKVDHKGTIAELALKDIPFAKATLANATQSSRQDAITQIAYVKDRVLVAGLSNEEFSSKLRSIPFPFEKVDAGASVEFYHGSHGRIETKSPVRTFVAYDVAGETNILAAYTCTPLVRVPLSQLKPGAKVQGTTIAELGNGNQPLDMIVYQKGDKEYLLLANSRRGVMKISTEGIDKAAGITARVPKTAGQSYETIESLKGVMQLAKLDKEHALILVQSGGAEGTQDLKTIELP